MTHWQVYVKTDGRWTTYGGPTTKLEAEAIVTELRLPLNEAKRNKKVSLKLSYAEPHCVPID